MRPNRLQSALAALSEAMHETNAAIEEMRSERDSLAAHIFVARRDYQNTPDTKGGKRHERTARMSWQRACALGFRGNLSEWERGAPSRGRESKRAVGAVQGAEEAATRKWKRGLGFAEDPSISLFLELRKGHSSAGLACR